MLRDYQETLLTKVDEAFAEQDGHVIAVAPCGAGKCLGRGTPVMMHDGIIKPVEQVCVGDLLMAPDGVARKVESVCSGIEELYRIAPKKGESFVVNKSHILSLKLSNDHDERKEVAEYGRIVNMELSAYLCKSKSFKLAHKGWRTGVDFVKSTPPLLDPYFLGLWLGDGCSRRCAITTGDEIVLNYCISVFTFLNLQTHITFEKGKCVTISGLKKEGKFNCIVDLLKGYNLLNNKHIPHAFKTACRNDRLALLAGIIDTDGYLGNGYYEIIQKNEKLADDILFVARSLGFAAYKKECIKSSQTGKKGAYFRCSISGNIDSIPVKLDRKKAKPRIINKNPLFFGFSVEPMGVGEYFGFELSGPDRLFLLGDFTVTHNTVMMAHRARTRPFPNVAIAHRRELVWQISAAFCEQGIHHRIIAPQTVINSVCAMHIERFGRKFYRADSDVGVASVDAMIKRTADPFFAACREWQTDECHHLQPDNKWGRAAAMCPSARGLGWSATPRRSDRRPLRAVFGRMVIGPSVRELIERGYLADYRIYGLPQTIDVSNVRVGANGEFNAVDLSGAAHASAITGDIVQTYLKYAAGLSGVTFAVDVGLAIEHAQAFRDAGVSAAVLSNETKDKERTEIIRAFRGKTLDQIVNVDILGEGFDCPGIQVASLARPTMSEALCVQQMMRPMRPDGDKIALILDHVGNVIRHGLPDTARGWTLDEPDRRRGVARLEIVVRVCASCLQPYEGFEPVCPFCGAERERPERNRPEAVEGDLTLYTPELLAHLRGEVERIAGPEQIPYGLGDNAAAGLVKQWNARQDAQTQLAAVIDHWAGHWVAQGESVRACYARFFHTFGMDTLSALAQSGPEMRRMIDRIVGSK